MIPHMITDTITNDEAVIQHFIEDPEFADLYLDTVMGDGDAEEISCVKAWYDEATRRRQSATYWDALITHAEDTAQSGYNLEQTLVLLNRAIAIIKNAIPATA